MDISMTSYLYPAHFDLVTPDGKIEKIEHINEASAVIEVTIENISPAFIGYDIPQEQVIFNFKSVLAQIGLKSHGLCLLPHLQINFNLSL